jgi:Zn finger protein HypA/HybF involved in hydrogenase expression
MKYNKENLTIAAKNNDTISDVVRTITGKSIASPSSINLVSKKLKEYGIDTSHFIGSSKGSLNLKVEKRTFEEVLVFNKNLINRVNRKSLLSAILKSKVLDYECEICKNKGIHLEKELVLQIDHKDGNWKNNSISNLRFLCPNCHSQTSTYGFNGTVKY